MVLFVVDSQCFYCVRSEWLRRGVYDMGFNSPSKIQETALLMLLADSSVFIFLLCCCTVFVLSVFKDDLGIHLTVTKYYVQAGVYIL